MDKKDINASLKATFEKCKAALHSLSARYSLLEKIRGEKPTDNRPVTERIKTFEDACKELGEKHPFVLAYQTNLRDPEVAEANRDILAYMKLRIIAAALNEGWEPEFTEDEWRWYPWLTLWTEEELSEKSDEWKADRHLISTGDYSGDFAGFAWVNSYVSHSAANTDFCSRLCFKSEALAVYCGKQFISLWADFYLIHK